MAVAWLETERPASPRQRLALDFDVNRLQAAGPQPSGARGRGILPAVAMQPSQERRDGSSELRNVVEQLENRALGHLLISPKAPLAARVEQ